MSSAICANQASESTGLLSTCQSHVTGLYTKQPCIGLRRQSGVHYCILFLVLLLDDMGFISRRVRQMTWECVSAHVTCMFLNPMLSEGSIVSRLCFVLSR